MEQYRILKAFKWLCAIGGIVTIVVVGTLLFSATAQGLSLLNTAVVCVVYLLMVDNIFKPLLDHTDKMHHTSPQMMKHRWAGAGAYAVAALGAIVVCNVRVPAVDIHLQLLTQFVLFAVFSAYAVREAKAEGEVTAGQLHRQSVKRKQSVQLLRRNAHALVESMYNNDVPAYIRQYAEQLRDDVRYVVPIRQEEATEIEREMCRLLDELSHLVYHYEDNAELIDEKLDMALSLLSRRRAAQHQRLQ